MKKLNLNKIDIFRIVILVILSAFLIFNIIKLFTNSTKKEKMSEEYFLDLIKENKLEYIDEISIQGQDCSGCVIFTENKGRAYLTCSDMYETKTDVNFKSICNIN